MDAITYTHARTHLAKTMEKVCDDHDPVIITRQNQRSVVMISLEDYQALEELNTEKQGLEADLREVYAEWESLSEVAGEG